MNNTYKKHCRTKKRIIFHKTTSDPLDKEFMPFMLNRQKTDD